MSKKVTTKTVSVKRGFMYHGNKVFPKTKTEVGEGDKKKVQELDTVVTLPYVLAMDLISAGKAVETKAKANVKIVAPVTGDEEDLDKVFGAEK